MTTSNFFRICFSLLLLSLISFSCNNVDPNEETNNDLVGNWNVTSLLVDGVEQVGLTLNALEIEFKITTEFGGETEWLFYDLAGLPSNWESDYTIQSDGSEVIIDGEVFNIEINDDQLELTGVVDGLQHKFEADRT